MPCSEKQSVGSPLARDSGQDLWDCGEVHPAQHLPPAAGIGLQKELRGGKHGHCGMLWVLLWAGDQPLESHRQIWEVPKHLVGSWAHCSPCTGGHACLTLHSLLSSPRPPAVRNPQASPEALSSRKQLFDSSWSFPTFRQLQGLGHCWGPTSHPLVGTESTLCHPPDGGGEVGLTGAKGGHARVRGKEVGTPPNHEGKSILKMLNDIFP